MEQTKRGGGRGGRGGRRVGLLGCAVCGAAGLACSAQAQPNIVLIMSDDAGYADVYEDPRDEIATPSLDAIARGGVTFTNGYVTASVCSPSRAGLITGRYQQRFGHEFNLASPHEASGLGMPTEELTIAERLAEAGYVSGITGKWHLGTAPGLRPNEQGFDEFRGMLAGSRSFFAEDYTEIKSMLSIDNDQIEDPEHLYVTDWIAEESADFIDRHAQRARRPDGRPFFLFASFTSPHTPMHALEGDLAAVEGTFSEYTPDRRKTYAAMMLSLDRGVGRILDALDRAGVADDTLVVYINDNGGATNNGSDNGRLRGMKGSKWEGGVRVPFAMRWPGVIPAGMVFAHPVSSLDIAATAVAAAGLDDAGNEVVEERALDGVDLVPFLTGERAGPPHEVLFWRRGVAAAVREGGWKLIRSEGNPTLLFDLGADDREQRDLSPVYPGVVERLLGRLEAWEAELAEPGWTEGEKWERNQRLKHRMEVDTRAEEREVP